MRQQSQEAYDVAVRSKSASDWAHFLQLRKAKKQQMKALVVKDASKAADLWAAENGSKAV
jgi:inactivated superfamily I helicase